MKLKETYVSILVFLHCATNVYVIVKCINIYYGIVYLLRKEGKKLQKMLFASLDIIHEGFRKNILEDD